MGIDLATYRARIGTFSGSIGVNVVTVVCFVKFSTGLKILGTVSFIALLLLIAGVEPNPGPVTNDNIRESHLTRLKKWTIHVVRNKLAMGVVALAVFIRIFYSEIWMFGIVLLLLCFGLTLYLAVIQQKSLTESVQLVAAAFKAPHRKNILPSDNKTDIETSSKEANTVSIEDLGTEAEEIQNKNTALLHDAETTQKEASISSSQDHERKTEEDTQKDTAMLCDVEPTTKEASVLSSQDHERKAVQDTHKDTAKLLDVETSSKEANTVSIEDLATEAEDIQNENTALLHDAETTQKEASISSSQDHERKTEEDTQKDTAMLCDVEPTTKEASILSSQDHERKAVEDTHKDTAKLLDVGTTPKEEYIFYERTAEEKPQEKQPHKISAMVCERKQQFVELLSQLGLSDRFPGKIMLQDVTAIDPKELNSEPSHNDYSSLPWMFLRRLISSHSEARDLICTSKHQNVEAASDDIASLLSGCTTEISMISPLDIVFLVFQCCDPILQQVIFQKLYLCKLSVPFLYVNYANDTLTPTLSIWPLRSVSIETSIKTGDNGITYKEYDALQLPTKVVAFSRLGRPSYSKSKLLNSLLTNHGCKTFFNADCPSGMLPRSASNGYVEMFWLPTVGVKRDKFEYPVTFLNMRGDLQQDFSENVVLSVGKLVDSIVCIVDIASFKDGESIIENILLNYHSVILIFANALQRRDIGIIQAFEERITSKNPCAIMKFLSTRKNNIELNAIDMAKNVTLTITGCIEKNQIQCLETRLQCVNLIDIDERSSLFSNANLHAMLLIEEMKKTGDPCSWKNTVTPVQGMYSTKLGELLKSHARETLREEIDELEKNIRNVRKKQTESVTKVVSSFINYFMTLSKDMLELELFLGCMNLYVESEKRKILPPIMHDYRCACDKLKQFIAQKESCDEKQITQQEGVIRDIEKQIKDASFSLDLLFREISHIYDSLIITKTDPATLGLPDVDNISKVIGKLFANGRQFELIDGESFYMPYNWILRVFEKVGLDLKDKRVLILSVLGLQSSGKSTLLNTMFGSNFATRTGRCTRGIHMQIIHLLKDNNDSRYSMFDAVAVVDSEGLRSPELCDTRHEHDNELATVITGIGDITLINVMGENTSEIRDILQVIVHAFLRLKRTIVNLDISKSCYFIHQNVASASASENMFSGLRKLIQTLDEITEEAAKIEGFVDITSFNQIIQFDSRSQVCYLKNLWHGNTPMANVNYEYSESVVALKHALMQKAGSMQDKSYKTLTDILIQSHNLWKGVLHEDFVFAFRNSLEIKAYLEMEKVMQAILWELEQTKLHGKLSEVSFAGKNEKRTLDSAAKETECEMLNFLFSEKTNAEKQISAYFESNKYKDITMQWKQSQKIRLENLCTKLEQVVKNRVAKCRESREVEILTHVEHSKHEKTLWKKSLEVAKEYKGKNLSQKQIDNLFEEIWDTFHRNVSTSTYENVHVKCLQNDFTSCLYNLLSTDRVLVKSCLERSNQLTQRPSFDKLTNSFDKIGITDDDVEFSWFRKGKDFVKGKTSMNHVKQSIERLLLDFDNRLVRLNALDDYITEANVSEILHNLANSVEEMLTNTKGITFKKACNVKVLVHVSHFACYLFNEHNERYFREHSVQIRLKAYKKQQKVSFEAHLQDRKTEDLFASLLCQILEHFIWEQTLNSFPENVVNKLYNKIPMDKNQLIINMLEKLLENDDFWGFTSYILTPKTFSEIWLTDVCTVLLFSDTDAAYIEVGDRLLANYFEKIRKCLKDTKERYKDKKSPSDINSFISEFLKVLARQNIQIAEESFRILRNEKDKISNVENMINELLAHMCKSEDDLKDRVRETNKKNIRWRTYNPVERLITKVWGCSEQCCFCGEPCAKNNDHQGSDHYSIQHRPACCTGVQHSLTEQASLETCTFEVQSSNTHECNVFNFLCNPKERKQCASGRHKFRNYKEFVKSWSIPPSNSMYETSKFWLWFVAHYKEKLKSYFGYKVDNVPSSWSDITKEEARKSLKEVYTA